MSIFIVLLVLVSLSIAGWIWFTTRGSPVGDLTPIVIGTQKGTTELSVAPDLPMSMNRPQGIEFSYVGWVKIDDFTTSYGQRRRIFSKGDCPGLYIDSTSNSLVVAVKTFGATETILIPNIPAKKWIHVALVVDQHSVNIYINGTLRQHHALTQMPDQSPAEPVRMGGDWDGSLANLNYYPRVLSSVEVHILSQDVPTSEEDPTPSAPRYFDLTWYTGRYGV
jgi:hypothetical protein